MAFIGRSLQKMAPLLRQSIQNEMSSSLKSQQNITRMFFPARTLSTSPNQLSAKPQSQAETVTVTIATRDGKFPVKCKIGDTLYDAVAAADVIEGYGACDGTLSCATCHLHFTDANYAQIGEPNDEELDMLDKCYDGTETSRLGCQVEITKEMDGWLLEARGDRVDVRD